jgi:hypothetical protein
MACWLRQGGVRSADHRACLSTESLDGPVSDQIAPVGPTFSLLSFRNDEVYLGIRIRSAETRCSCQCAPSNFSEDSKTTDRRHGKMLMSPTEQKR